MLITVLLVVSALDTKTLKNDLVKQYGEAQRARIERGVDQVASLWKKEDGDLAAFAKENFLSEPDPTFERFESNFEALDGHFLEISRALKTQQELDKGPVTKADEAWAAYEAASHVTDDLFSNKLAFIALLNFPLSTLKERLELGPKWSRRDWAEARLTSRFARRVPADVVQEQAAAQTAASLYIDSYNIWMHHLLDEKGQRLFPKGKRLITHWNLRDELKAAYSDPDGLPRQRMIIKVMERIVTQTIPAAVIDNPNVDWNPYTNKVTQAQDVEDNAPKKPADVSGRSEPDTRYAKLQSNWAASKKADPFSPASPTAIDRAFDLGAEIPEARVKQMLTEVLSSPLVPKIGAEIKKRLGRDLEPADLWYAGFVKKQPEDKLDALCRAKYPTADAFAKDIPRILKDLGFAPDKAKFLAEHIIVDPARGAGHALQAQRRGDFPHLRTRVEKDGMNYKGYNIAVHELGHNIEQVFSLYEVDHTLLAGVPNTAFTEALAFTFQNKDLELLGQSKPDAESERLRVLNDFWMTYEIAGVALVDVAVWHWMYEHPKAKPAELRDATLKIAKDVWNQYYAPVLGGKDTPLLGIYSHMISYPLYLFNYPLGHLIAFQIEEQVRKAGKLGPEFERMAKLGSVSPDMWMVNASGEPVGAGPLLRAAEAALK
jgi:hypothetical protein